MNALLAAALRWLAELAARLVSDWRRDAALKDAGRSDEIGRSNAETAAAERRSASVREKSDAETIDDLENGRF